MSFACEVTNNRVRAKVSSSDFEKESIYIYYLFSAAVTTINNISISTISRENSFFWLLGFENNKRNLNKNKIPHLIINKWYCSTFYNKYKEKKEEDKE